MAKLNLLQIVDEILSEMDSDEVNSIEDTVEATQVAKIVRSVYRSMVSSRNWSSLRRVVNIDPISDPALPNYLLIADPIKEVVSVSYNVARATNMDRRIYERMSWREPEEFLRLVSNRNNNNANVDVIIDPSGVELLILNDKPPEYYTAFDDKTLVFDSYDSGVETTLQSHKTQMIAYIMPPDLELLDDAVPLLPEEAFSSLVTEATSAAQAKLNQVIDRKAEQESTRQRSWLSRKQWTVNGGIRFQDYGRRNRKGGYYSNSPLDKDPTFRRDK